ncbi:hypothetical protein [Rhizobium leguminosarum]|uniref:Transglycosylase SLT domain-containing protein n=1 Tax=Rhizobium leguminosarum TaxID=384 RepID=A0A7K3VD52_RHILE|nr:hypothetical protein [Rhizobium leguminosarum]NEK15026.1 hypothetical protein [Rhizobium leguminosarum]
MRIWFVPFIFLFCVYSAYAQTPSFEINPQNCGLEKQMAAHARTRLDNDLQKAFHDVLMVNELADGCGSLQFSDANMQSHTNGFSFGMSQFDLATRPGPSLATLNKIIACSRQENVSPVLSKADYKFLQENAHYSTFALKQESEKWSRFAAIKPAIEASLRSRCGQAYIENSYIAEVRDFERIIGPWWKTIRVRNPAMTAAEQFFKLYELDLRNVYGGTENFRKVVNLESSFACNGLCGKKLVPIFTIDQPVTVSDLIRYMLTTNCYGYVPQKTRQQDALRRLNTVLGKVDIQALPLDDSDKSYLTTDFADVLARNKKGFPGSPDGKLQELVKVANGGSAIVGDETLMDSSTLGKLVAACEK